MLILLSPFAPHIAEELWSLAGHEGSITYAAFPQFVEDYIIESSFEYPVSFNGKMRFKLTLPRDMKAPEIEKLVREDENTIKYAADKPIKKIIVVPLKIINVVC